MLLSNLMGWQSAIFFSSVHVTGMIIPRIVWWYKCQWHVIGSLSLSVYYKLFHKVVSSMGKHLEFVTHFLGSSFHNFGPDIGAVDIFLMEN